MVFRRIYIGEKVYGSASLITLPPHAHGLLTTLPVDLCWVWMVAMLVDGVVVFASGVESYGIWKEVNQVREQRQIWKASRLMMGQKATRERMYIFFIDIYIHRINNIYCTS